MKFAERFKIVPIASALDISSTVSADSINMKNFHSATFLINIQTLGTASSVLTVYSGATDAALTSALTFKYAFGGAAITVANCDVIAAETAAATLTLTYGTYSDYMLIVEVDSAAMDVANGEEWLTLRFTDPGTATGNVTIFAILEARYTGNLSVSALA